MHEQITNKCNETRNVGMWRVIHHTTCALCSSWTSEFYWQWASYKIHNIYRESFSSFAFETETWPRLLAARRVPSPIEPSTWNRWLLLERKLSSLCARRQHQSNKPVLWGLLLAGLVNQQRDAGATAAGAARWRGEVQGTLPQNGSAGPLTDRVATRRTGTTQTSNYY